MSTTKRTMAHHHQDQKWSVESGGWGVRSHSTNFPFSTLNMGKCLVKPAAVCVSNSPSLAASIFFLAKDTRLSWPTILFSVVPETAWVFFSNCTTGATLRTLLCFCLVRSGVGSHQMVDQFLLGLGPIHMILVIMQGWSIAAQKPNSPLHSSSWMIEAGRQGKGRNVSPFYASLSLSLPPPPPPLSLSLSSLPPSSPSKRALSL